MINVHTLPVHSTVSCVYPFPTLTYLQQTTLKISTQIYVKSKILKVQLLNGVENIVVKGEIAHHEQFILLLLCFNKASAADA